MQEPQKKAPRYMSAKARKIWDEMPNMCWDDDECILGEEEKPREIETQAQPPKIWTRLKRFLIGGNR